ncbi:MAG: hypothetical protein AB1489_32610 [Acidobacteriota bacterium]
MSSTAGVAPVAATHKQRLWSLWVNQAIAIFRLEVKKNFLGKRALLIYLIALMPILLFAALALFPYTANKLSNPSNATIAFATIYETFLLRTIVFFGCAWIFMNLFRGDLVDRSLHYYFLAPVRREVLVIGKYLSGLLTAVLLFNIMTAGCLFFLYLPRGYAASLEHIFNGPGFSQAFSYFGIVALACAGYGAVFLMIGLFFRNPIFPAIAVYGWEFINFLLPPLLKKISVTHYLQSLSPVPMSEGPFALIAEPAPAWLAILGLLGFTIVILIFSGLHIRRMEIKYGSD